MRPFSSDGDDVPRRKTKADEAYNVRRRAKRAMQRAMREGKTELAEYLSDRISKSYLAGRVEEQRAEARKVLSTLRKIAPARVGKDVQERRNQVFLRQLSRAAAGEGNVVTGMTRRTGFAAAMEVNVFFMATRDVWENVPGGSRDPLGTYARERDFASYQAAYEYVMSQQQEALARIDALFPVGGMEVSRGQTIENIMPVTDVIYADGYMQVAALINVMR